MGVVARRASTVFMATVTTEIVHRPGLDSFKLL